MMALVGFWFGGDETVKIMADVEFL